MMVWRRRSSLIRSGLISIWMLKSLYIERILWRISRRIHDLCIWSWIWKIWYCWSCHLLFHIILLENSKRCLYLMIRLLIICNLVTIIPCLFWRGDAIFMIIYNFVNMARSWSNVLVIRSNWKIRSTII